MKILRSASEDEMLLAFLKGELRSERFSGELRAALSCVGAPEALVTSGDLSSAQENDARKAVMSAFRGYPDRDLFAEYPRDLTWYYVRFEPDDLAHIRYISYCYWDELSQGTSSPLAAAGQVRRGVTVYGVPNEPFWKALAHLRAGGSFAPIILIARDAAFTTLEGHVRLTAYAMDPALFDGTFGYVGYADPAPLRRRLG